jgi:predicted nucleotidyltransferase
MKPSDSLVSHRSRVRLLTQRYRLSNPRVFGSALHGTDTEASDLDILVDAGPGATLLDLSGLQVELEDLLGAKVDVLTPGDLPARFRDQVLAEAKPV